MSASLASLPGAAPVRLSSRRRIAMSASSRWFIHIGVASSASLPPGSTIFSFGAGRGGRPVAYSIQASRAVWRTGGEVWSTVSSTVNTASRYWLSEKAFKISIARTSVGASFSAFRGFSRSSRSS
jgi:hypothetical protein